MKNKQDLFVELEITDNQTKALIDDLDDSQLAVPYEKGINPPIWELGHATFFYEYFLLRQYITEDPLMSGYDEIWDSFEIHHRSRWKKGVVPNKTKTFDYYHRTLDQVRSILTCDIVSEQACYLIEYCIYHQNMHIESLIWARQTLGYPAPTSFHWPKPSETISDRKDIYIDQGSYRIGIEDDSTQFSFDNERPSFRKEIDGFWIANQLVSNQEFLDFVTDKGGYQQIENWSFGGRQWLEDIQNPRTSPEYWYNVDGEWFERFFDQEVPLDPKAAAIHINYWEAEAYCRWADRRLPTEFEWEAAARGQNNLLFPWGNKMNQNNVDMDAKNLGRCSSSEFKNGQTTSGCYQMLGTAWEWTSSQYLPFDGFTMDMYPYMSTLQFGDHKTTRGGSCATSSCLIRNTYRQAFLPNRSDIFVGFRTVKDSKPSF